MHLKIQIDNIDKTNFMVHESNFHGETVYLIHPIHFGAKWTKENLIYRSTLVNSDGEIISAGFPKFFNYGEQSDLYPDPAGYNDAFAVEKLDGSLICISKYKDHIIARSRGTVNAYTSLNNGSELYNLIMSNNNLLEFLSDYYTTPFTILVEWVTPTNQIIIKYKEPTLYLIGMIVHDTYSLIDQLILDSLSHIINLSRPNKFKFDSLKKLISFVKEFKDKEGICLYFNNSKNIVKIKGDHYLKLHKAKSHMSNIDNIIDIFIELNFPSYDEIFSYFESTFDYEIASFIQPQLFSITNAYKKLLTDIERLKDFMSDIKSLSRKDAAIIITKTYNGSYLLPLCFNAFNNKILKASNYKKILLHILDENKYDDIHAHK